MTEQGVAYEIQRRNRAAPRQEGKMKIHGTADRLRQLIEHAKAQWQALMKSGRVNDAMKLSLILDDLRYTLANLLSDREAMRRD